MTTFKLIKTPNQKFSTNINNHLFEFIFRTFRGITYITVLVDGELQEGSVRAIPNLSLFNSVVNTLAGGEFKFVCTTDDYPHYTMFNGVDAVFTFTPYGE